MATKTIDLPLGQYALIASPGDGPFSFSANANIRYLKAGRSIPLVTRQGVSLAKGLSRTVLGALEQDSYLWAIQDGSADTQPAQLTKLFGVEFDDPGDWTSGGGGGSNNLAFKDEGTDLGVATSLNVTGVGGSLGVAGSVATLTVPALIVYSGGTLQGYATTINFTGKGVSTTTTNGVSTVTIAGSKKAIYLSASGSDDSAIIMNAYASIYYGGNTGGTIYLDGNVFLFNSSIYTSFGAGGGDTHGVGAHAPANSSNVGNGTVISAAASDSASPLQESFIVYYGYEIISATLASGGTGYSVGDIITLSSAQGGAIIVVRSVSSGVIVTFSIAHPGAASSGSVTPVGSGATVAPSGGSGASFNVTYSGNVGAHYSVVMTSATTFNFISPNPSVGVIAAGTVGTLFSNQMTFTVNAGSTPYIRGDSFSILSYTFRSCIAMGIYHQGTVTIRGMGKGCTVLKFSKRCSTLVNMNLGGAGTAATFTGSISGTVLTITAFASGNGVVIGSVITGAGIAANTTITGFLTGTNYTGTYQVNNSQTVSSETMTTANGLVSLYRWLTIQDLTIDSQNITPVTGEFSYPAGIVVDMYASASVQGIRLIRVDTKNSHLPKFYPWKTNVSIIAYQFGYGSVGRDPYAIERVYLEDCNFCTDNDAGGYGGNYGIQIAGQADNNPALYTPGLTSTAGSDDWMTNIQVNDIGVVRCKWDSGSAVPLGGTAPTTGFLIGAQGHGFRWLLEDCEADRSWDDDFEINSGMSITMIRCRGGSGHYESIYLTNLGGMPSSQSQVTLLKSCRVTYDDFIQGTTDPLYSPLWVNGSAYSGSGISYGHIILEDFEGAAKFTGNIQAITIDTFTTKGRQPQQTLLATTNGDSLHSGDNYNDPLGTLGITIINTVGRSNINLRNIHITDNALIDYAGYTGCFVSSTYLTFDFMGATNFRASNIKLTNNLAPVIGSTGSGTITFTPIRLFYNGLGGAGAGGDSGPGAGSITYDNFAHNMFASPQAYIMDAGLKADFAVSSNNLTCVTNPTVEHRAVFQGGYYAAGNGNAGPFVDSCWWVGSTPGATISGHKTGIMLKRLDTRQGGTLYYLECYITDNGTNTILNIDKVVNGTRTNLATATSGTRVSNGVQYWVMASIRGNLVSLSYRSTQPTSTLDQGGTGTIGSVLPYTLTGFHEVYKFGADQLGWGGFSWTPADAAATLQHLSMEALAVVSGVGIDDVTMNCSNNIDNITAISYADPTNLDKWVRFETPFNMTNFNLIGLSASTTKVDQTAGAPAAYLQKVHRSGTWLANPAARTVTVSGSTPFVYTNSDGYVEDFNAYGTGITSIFLSRDKGVTSTQVAATATNFSVRLRPSDVVTINYSSTPTVTVVPIF